MHTSTSHIHSFGDLRSLLHQRPSASNWDLICDYLDALPEPHLEEVTHYLLTHLTHWPAKLRHAPHPWLMRALNQPLTPHWNIIRSASINTALPALPSQHFIAPLQHIHFNHPQSPRVLLALQPLLLNFQHMHIEHWQSSPQRLILTLHNLKLPALHSLSINHCRLNSAAIQHLCASSWFPQLKRINLAHNLIDDAALHDLLSLSGTHLQHLNLSHNLITIDGARLLIQHPKSQQLLTLSMHHNTRIKPHHLQSLLRLHTI